MMKKAIKKLLAALLAVAMVCAMAIPAFAYDTKEDLNTKHEYDAFQIFNGDVTGNDTDGFKISNVTWGKNIPHPEDFLEKLTKDSTIGGEFKTDFTPQEAVAVISKWHDSDNNSIAFARFVCNYIYTDSNANREPVIQGGHTGGFELPMAGYYLIVDTSPFSGGDSYHAYNSFLLKVNQKNYHVQITPKVVKPTVKKEVYDNNDIGSTGGWGSSADHAINEPFQFRLIAKLPASENNGRAYDYYKEYAVCFTDTLSDGITFDKLDTVEITNGDGSTPQEITEGNYTLKRNDPQSITLSIDDVKTCVPDLNKGATITVTYTAHLNEKAYVNTVGGGTDNKNSVYLEYSNNPRISTSLDHTPESEVRVYTYQLNNTKYRDDDTPGNELAGAGFRLYSDEACHDEDEIKLKMNDDGTYSRDFSTEGKGVEMISGQDGQFNVKGLDAGTYYLRETKTPDGYSACADKKIVISATHTEYNVNLSGESNLNNKIINIKAGGITLPSTGGIGTTLFYVVGGGLMVAAIVLLVTKKRMENK